MLRNFTAQKTYRHVLITKKCRSTLKLMRNSSLYTLRFFASHILSWPCSSTTLPNFEVPICGNVSFLCSTVPAQRALLPNHWPAKQYLYGTTDASRHVVMHVIRCTSTPKSMGASSLTFVAQQTLYLTNSEHRADVLWMLMIICLQRCSSRYLPRCATAQNGSATSEQSPDYLPKRQRMRARPSPARSLFSRNHHKHFSASSQHSSVFTFVPLHSNLVDLCCATMYKPTFWKAQTTENPLRCIATTL